MWSSPHETAGTWQGKLEQPELLFPVGDCGERDKCSNFLRLSCLQFNIVKKNDLLLIMPCHLVFFFLSAQLCICLAL